MNMYKIDPQNRLVFGPTGKGSKKTRSRTVVDAKGTSVKTSAHIPLDKQHDPRASARGSIAVLSRGPGHGKVAPGRASLDGKFSVDEKNQLSYSLTQPSQGEKKQIKLAGQWALDDDHNLLYQLDAAGKAGDTSTLKLKGEIISVDAYSLAFALATRNDKGSLSLYTLTLTGKWQADENNCLAFEVEKGIGASAGTLTFTGTWAVDKNHEVIYRVKNKASKITNELTFKGRWDISERNCLVYSLSGDDDSRFVFGVEFERYDEQKKALVYKVAVGGSSATRAIELSGEWKFCPKTGLLFEMNYAEGRVERVVFGASCVMADGTECQVKLKNKLGKSVGVELELSRKIFDDAGSVFLKTAVDRGAWEITAGVGIKF